MAMVKPAALGSKYKCRRINHKDEPRQHVLMLFLVRRRPLKKKLVLTGQGTETKPTSCSLQVYSVSITKMSYVRERVDRRETRIPKGGRGKG